MKKIKEYLKKVPQYFKSGITTLLFGGADYDGLTRNSVYMKLVIAAVGAALLGIVSGIMLDAAVYGIGIAVLAILLFMGYMLYTEWLFDSGRIFSVIAKCIDKEAVGISIGNGKVYEYSFKALNEEEDAVSFFIRRTSNMGFKDGEVYYLCFTDADKHGFNGNSLFHALPIQMQPEKINKKDEED